MIRLKNLTLDVKKSNSSNETPNVMTVGVEKYDPRVEHGPRDLKAKLLPTLPWMLVQKRSFKLRIYTTYINW
jgi:hypothetical protein